MLLCSELAVKPPKIAGAILSGCPSKLVHISNISFMDSLLLLKWFAHIAPATIREALDPSPLDIGISFSIFKLCKPL